MEATLHATRILRHVKIPIADGVRLDAHLVLPDAPGPFPAVFDYYPYRKDDLTAGTLRLHVYLAQRGFAALRIDIRGTGSSEGLIDDEYTPQEQADALEIIAWLAVQPWCSGCVGMFGTSYGGFNSLQVAMHRPPALKAICPMYFTDNRYTDDCHYRGGARQMLYDMATYGLEMVVENALPPEPEAVGAAWSTLWQARLERYEPWFLQWMAHPRDGPYWRHGSLCEDYGAVQAATLLIGGWRDGYTNCNLRTFASLRCPKKLIIGPWMHELPDVGVPGPAIDHLHEMVRFFGHWLKGLDTGVMDEPPIAIYVQKFDPPAPGRRETSGFWRSEPGWPLARGRDQDLYLDAEGALRTAEPKAAAEASYAYQPSAGTTYGMFPGGAPFLLPADQRLEAPGGAAWSTEPLTEPLEILGQPRAVLHLTVPAPWGNAAVRLIDVAPDGAAALVSKGVLNLAHRASHTAPTPLEPGQIYEVTIELDATSWLFEPGHRVQIVLSGADFPNIWPSPQLYTGTVYCGPAHPSRLVLPALAAADPPLPAPRYLAPPPSEPLMQVHAAPQVWRVTRDHLAGTVEMSIAAGGESQVGQQLWFSHADAATAYVCEADPASAGIRSDCRMVTRRAGQTIDVHARGDLSSTADALHLLLDLEVTVNGLPHHRKHWAQSWTRELV